MTLLGVVVRWVQLGAALGLIGIFTMLLLAGRSDRADRARVGGARPALMRWLVVALLLSGVAALAYQAAVATGRAGALIEAATWIRVMEGSQFGTVWMVRHGLLLLLAGLVLLREREVVHRGLDRVARRGLGARRPPAPPPWPGRGMRRPSSPGDSRRRSATPCTSPPPVRGSARSCPSLSSWRSASRESGADARPVRGARGAPLLRRGPRRDARRRRHRALERLDAGRQRAGAGRHAVWLAPLS